MEEKKRVMRRFLGILLSCMAIVGIWEMKMPAEAAGTAAVRITGGSWSLSGSDWEYRLANGARVRNGIYQINGKLYCFGADGWMDVGWIRQGTAWYYAGTDGSLWRNSWIYSGGIWYYLKADGKMADDEPVLWKGKYYYLKKGGSMAAGEWVKWKGIYYYAGGDGILVSDTWIKSGSSYYYLKANRQMAVDSLVIWKGKRYYLDAAGRMAENRLIKANGYYYYAGADGALYTGGWGKVNGCYYYFFSNGVMAINRWVFSGGSYYYLGANGQLVRNSWVGDRYVDSQGAMVTNQYRGEYYLGANGRLQNVEQLSGKYIIVGDSRTWQMEIITSAMASDVSFLCKSGAKYSWFNTIGYPQLAATLERNPDKVVVLAFGVNDPEDLEQYIFLYRMLMIRYPKTKFYMLSVNPVNPSEAGGLYTSAEIQSKSQEIVPFNTYLKRTFGSRYLDSYSYLLKTGFTTYDGLHYDRATYLKLYQWLMKKIK